jgi:hypothetical protein
MTIFNVFILDACTVNIPSVTYSLDFVNCYSTVIGTNLQAWVFAVLFFKNKNIAPIPRYGSQLTFNSYVG